MFLKYIENLIWWRFFSWFEHILWANVLCRTRQCEVGQKFWIWNEITIKKVYFNDHLICFIIYVLFLSKYEVILMYLFKVKTIESTVVVLCKPVFLQSMLVNKRVTILYLYYFLYSKLVTTKCTKCIVLLCVINSCEMYPFFAAGASSSATVWGGSWLLSVFFSIFFYPMQPLSNFWPAWLIDPHTLCPAISYRVCLFFYLVPSGHTLLILLFCAFSHILCGPSDQSS